MAVKFRSLIHHLLFPHESNNYKAKTLHNSSIVFYILLLLAFQLLTGTVKRIRPGVLGYATDITVEKVLYLINQKRTQFNLPPLTLSQELSEAATKKASDMFAYNYWAHVSPTGTSPWSFITSSGYQYLYAGENLARDFNTAEEVVNAWMNSSTHRDNILKPEYSDIGLAVMNGNLRGQDTTLVVQEFGSKVGSKDRSIIAQAIPSLAPGLGQISESAIQKEILLSTEPKPMMIPPTISKTLSLVMTEFLLIVLFLDSLYLWKYKTLRVSGHSLAHLIFLAALIGAMGATGIGVIL
ncbi:hypothetical protein HY945_03630 [Candidatus Gottesmanbacteria bacterium]|nr:hypothetical protein [Candidatus Gottesmanbacteria bacterium]